MKVRMINSVGELVAGTELDVPDDVGDRFILLGYAEGELSREYSDDEIADALDQVQEVSLGG